MGAWTDEVLKDWKAMVKSARDERDEYAQKVYDLTRELNEEKRKRLIVTMDFHFMKERMRKGGYAVEPELFDDEEFIYMCGDPKCHAFIQDEWRYCPSCGKFIDRDYEW